MSSFVWPPQGSSGGGGTLTFTGDVTGSGTSTIGLSLVATTNATLTTLSALSLPLSQTTGVLPIANGGTDNGSLAVTAGGTLYTDGTKIVNVGAGTSSFVLTSQGASPPIWAVAPAAVTGSYSQAFFGAASSWSTASATFADPTNSGGNTLTVRQSSGITLTAASSNTCGITFTPASSSAIYLITAQIGLFSSGPFDTSIQLIDGSTVISVSPGLTPEGTSVNGTTPITLTGIHVPGNTSAHTVKIQLATTAGTADIAANGGSGSISVEWTIVRIA